MFASTRLLALCTVLAASVSAAPITASRSAVNKGQGTFFPGLGACGLTNSSNDLIVAVSTELFDNFPGAGANPNDNPICGKSITAHFGSKSVKVKVVDRCVGCAKDDLDMSPAAFSKLANEAKGRINITWSFT
ncbi:barwin-like endoglucanase [Artomyces pyxidatus]|uniref:Barwin-like endoglucanase n=1 Tax=Artomyces pyxidatus TaxID=48021 RepID=A0ACB8SKB8_9AGAM|nr:barwin-like endoglucanase [Artomyces pyxidatus]